MANISYIGSYQENLQDNLTIVRKMVPTIVIAVGGSGKKTATHLRRMFFEKYGSTSLPIVEFLYFDTDTGDLTGGEFDQLYNFSTQDTVNATINKLEFDRIMDNLEGLHPHINSWFARNKVADACPGGVTNGAKQIRPLGKLSFFLKYDEFCTKLEAKMRAVCSEPAQKAARNLLAERGINPQFDSDFEIVIIGSIAGGTGSGCFIDVAFAAKELARRQLQSEPVVSGILYLPGAFDGLVVGQEREKMYANGYAALKELNYYLNWYSEDSNAYNVEIEWKRNEKRKVPAPPYHDVYLLEDTNSGNTRIGTQDALNDVYQMAAEFLFLDFNESAFSVKKRSIYSNVKPNLGTKTKIEFDDSGYVDYYANRYSSFGLSQIRLGRDKLAKAAASMLCADIIKTISQENQLQAGWFKKEGWKEFGLDDEAILRNFAYNESQEFTIKWNNGSQDIHNNSTAGYQKLLDSIHKMNTENFSGIDCENFIREKFDNLNKLIDLNNAEIKDKLQDNHRNFTQAARQSIFNRINNLQQEAENKCLIYYKKRLSEFQTDGISYADDFLSLLENHLIALKNEFDNLKNTRTDLLTHCAFDSASGKNSDYLELQKKYEESKSLLPLPLFKKFAVEHYKNELEKIEGEYKEQLRKKTIELYEVKNKEFETLLRNTIYKLISDRMIEVIEYLIDFFKKEKLKLDNFKSAMIDTVKEFEQNFKIFTSGTEQHRNVELALDWDIVEFKKQICKNLNNSNYEDLIIRETNQFICNFDNGLTSDDLYGDLLQRCDEFVKDAKQRLNSFKERISGYGHSILANFKPEGNLNSAINLFNRTYPSQADKERKLKQLIDFAKPRLRINNMNGHISDIRLMGCDKNETVFINSVTNLGGIFGTEEFSKDEVVFFNEIVGFPACRLGSVELMIDAYKKDIYDNADNQWLRHSDKNFDKFKDIVMPDQDEANRRIAKIKPFFLGWLLNLIKFEGGNFVVIRQDETGRTRQIALKSDLQASIFILSDEQRDFLDRRVTIERGKIFNQWEENNSIENFYNLYALLISMLPKNDSIETMFIRTIKDTQKELLIKIFNLLNLGESGKELYQQAKADRDTLCEKHADIEKFYEYISSIDLDSISTKTTYYEKELDNNIRVLKF